MQIYKELTFDSKEDWLKYKKNGLGGSCCSSILGYGRKTSTQLYKEKKGLIDIEDISHIPQVQYGLEAEKYIRGLFALDYPQYEVIELSKNDKWVVYENIEKPFLHATLDGMLIEKETNRKGILEIKTAEINSSLSAREWDQKVPMSYFLQILHYLLVTGFDFAILHAQHKFNYNGEVETKRKSYFCERKDFLEDIKIIEREETTFWNENILKGIEPALKIDI